MKKYYRNLIIQVLIVLSFILASNIMVNNVYAINSGIESIIDSTSCTVFTVSDGDRVFFGNNEDEGGDRKYTEIWFSPAMDSETYGCAFLGFNGNEPGGNDIDGLAIGGINTEGLCFDANGILPVSFVNYQPSLGPTMSSISSWEITLRECSSVSEVIEWYQTHNMGGWWGNQLHWADKTGDAVIVSPTPNNTLAFTLKTGEYLVSTNFNPVDHSQGWYPCQRYEYVSNRLQYLTSEGDITRQDLVPILNAVSLPGTQDYIGTVYSNIFDLQSQTIYLYIQRYYDHEVIFDLEIELEKGSHTYSIPGLANSSNIDLIWLLLFFIGIPISLVGIGFIVHSLYKKKTEIKSG